MIKEFAVQPEALVGSFKDFRYLIEKFGVGHGRLISEFPSKWPRLVYDALSTQQLSEQEKHAIIAYLKTKLGQTDLVYPSRRPGGDGTKPWTLRAIEASKLIPFDGIISLDEIENQTNILSPQTLTDLDPRFASSHNLKIDRTAESLVGCIGLLVEAGRTIKLVDPYINPKLTRYRRVIQALVDRTSILKKQTEIEIYRSYDNDIHKSNLLKDCQEWLPKISSGRVTFRVFLLPKASVYMHNRFILTNIGGAMYGTGLDEWDDESPKAQEDVVLLDHKEFASKWSEYSGRPADLIIES